MKTFRLSIPLPVRLGVLCVVAMLYYQPSAHAQAQFGRVEEMRTNAGTYYFYTRPATPTIQVYVMGTVRAPGVYEISDGTTLGELMALAGGPPSNVRPSYTKVTALLRLYRPRGGSQDVIFEKTLEEAFADPSSHPVLAHGDVVTIDVTQREMFNWRDVTRVVSTVGIVTLAIERLFRTF